MDYAKILALYERIRRELSLLDIFVDDAELYAYDGFGEPITSMDAFMDGSITSDVTMFLNLVFYVDEEFWRNIETRYG